MRALILCGGFATRLDPITYFVPKSLLPIGIAGKPIVEYIVDDLVKSGIHDIVLSTNAKFLGHFDYWVKNILEKHNRVSGMTETIITADKKKIKMEFVVENTMNNHEKFGAIKGINYAINQAKIDTDLIIVAGDNLYDFSIASAIEDFKKYRKPIVGLYDTNSIDEAKKLGVVELDGNRLKSFSEKPEKPATTIVSTGIYIIPKEMLCKFDEYLKSGNNADAIGNFIKWMMGQTEVLGHVYKGKWYDIGTLDTYRRVFDEYSHKPPKS